MTSEILGMGIFCSMNLFFYSFPGTRILFTVLSEGRGSAPPSYMGEFLLTYAELKTALNKSFRVVDTKSTRERDIGMLTFDSVRYTGSGR